MKHIVVIILNLSLVTAIYNATFASPHQFPYSVLVKRLNKFCTGAIITDWHVITSAHCVMSSSDSVFVTVGAHKYSDDGEEIESKKFWIHENFTMPSGIHDLAIVELKKQLKFDDKIQKIKISMKENVNEKEITIAGWGFRSEWDRSDVLMFTKMQLISLEECLKFKSHYFEELNEKNLCSTSIDGMPCSGDSGAPFVYQNEIIGIFSYVKDAEDGKSIGYNDCRANVPAVAIKILPYLDWISEKTGIKFDERELK